MSLLGQAAPARAPVSSILKLTQRLIRVPSQAGIDSNQRILSLTDKWLRDHGVDSEILRDDSGQAVAVMGKVQLHGPGPVICLNACLDTASFGDRKAWEYEPTSAAVVDGWLHGRGSADSKVAVAIFAHLAAALTNGRHSQTLRGRVLLLFDGDEHTGQFRGVKRFAEVVPSIDGVMIGYPGNYGVVTGARGFYRACLTTYGTARHSGTKSHPRENAIVKAAHLVRELGNVELPATENSEFPLNPSLTVTEVSGGKGYSSIPDQCHVRVDIRLTPRFGRKEAQDVIKRAVRAVDNQFPARARTTIEEEESWPAYRLSKVSHLATSLQAAAEQEASREVPLVVCGPSNVGNFFASKGIEATCGFGVTYKNIHAANERIEVSSVQPIYNVYLDALARLLG